MTSISYSDLHEILATEAEQLFCEMALAHIEAERGNRLFMRMDSMAGPGLHFSGDKQSQDWWDFDPGGLDDLVSFGLLHLGFSSRGDQNYRLSSQGLHYYRWLMEKKGAPIVQVDELVRSTVLGPDFARQHPGAAHHLSEAFDLLWSDRTDTQTLAEIGEHLRGTLMDLADDITARAEPREKPYEQLSTYLSDNTGDLGEREVAVLLALLEALRAVLSLDQRLTHVRDESGKGQPLRGWEEARRAAFVTAFVCHEFYRGLVIRA